ncbi:MAG: hypothetical protein LBM25_08165 [Bacteroidales bacterium]|nr:hypothetical protein [Bacteroidales bacterium]
MIYNEDLFLNAISDSFKAYKERGARSTEKIKPLHKAIADILKNIWGNDFDVFYLSDTTKEKQVEGKYYFKDIDITITKDEKPVFCLGIKFVTSNYKQNANNYFENMMGETANIQAVGTLPYAQLIILRHKTPYYKKNESINQSKIEIINDKDLQKYLKLNFDTPQVHRPKYIGIKLIDVDEETFKVTSTSLDENFSSEIASLLKDALSLDTFFNNIYNYKNYFISKNN